MKFDAEMGMTYDTIFYGVLFFNFERTKAHFEKSYSVLNDDFDYFFELKKRITPPAPELYSFFYCDWTKPSLMAMNFFSCFKFGADSFSEYVQRIQDYKDEFKKSLFSHFFRGKYRCVN